MQLVGKKILVIDDDPEVQTLVKHCLQETGAEVTPATDAQEGLKKAAAAAFDLVLLDLKMPDFDGMALLKTLQLSSTRPAIVVFSGVESRHITQQAVQDGALGFVHKPISPDTFAEQISEIMNWSSLEPR